MGVLSIKRTLLKYSFTVCMGRPDGVLEYWMGGTVQLGDADPISFTWIHWSAGRLLIWMGGIRRRLIKYSFTGYIGQPVGVLHIGWVVLQIRRTLIEYSFTVWMASWTLY